VADFDWPVSWGTKPSYKARTIKTQYGDGYAQRLGDGINNVITGWSVVINNCPNADAEAIIAFLASKGGYQSFSWVPLYGSSEVRVICETWDRPTSGPAVSDITATFEKVPVP